MYTFAINKRAPSVFSINTTSLPSPTTNDDSNILQQENIQLKQEIQFHKNTIKTMHEALSKTQTELNEHKDIIENGHQRHSRPPGIYPVKITRLPKNEVKLKAVPVPIKLPTKVDLRTKFPPVIDQGDLGSCSGCAIAGLVGYDIPGFVGSPLFMYYNECLLEEHVGDDSGATIADTIRTLIKYGICPESDWPYNTSKFSVKPVAKAYTDGLKHKAIAYSHIPNNLTTMKQNLASGSPFILGIDVYDSFETVYVEKTGMVPMPNLKKDSLLGGHAVVCVGYDDSIQRFIMRNSWGPKWGDKGYFYLPYAYLTNINLSSDLWCVTKLT